MILKLPQRLVDPFIPRPLVDDAEINRRVELCKGLDLFYRSDV